MRRRNGAKWSTCLCAYCVCLHWFKQPTYMLLKVFFYFHFSCFYGLYQIYRSRTSYTLSVCVSGVFFTEKNFHMKIFAIKYEKWPINMNTPSHIFELFDKMGRAYNTFLSLCVSLSRYDWLLLVFMEKSVLITLKDKNNLKQRSSAKKKRQEKSIPFMFMVFKFSHPHSFTCMIMLVACIFLCYQLYHSWFNRFDLAIDAQFVLSGFIEVCTFTFVLHNKHKSNNKGPHLQWIKKWFHDWKKIHSEKALEISLCSLNWIWA